MTHLRSGEHLGDHRRSRAREPEDIGPPILDDDGGAAHRGELAQAEQQTSVHDARGELGKLLRSTTPTTSPPSSTA